MSIFSQVQFNKVGSNTFDLSHERKMSMDMGVLTPILVIDTIPGDTFRISTSQLLRFAPLVAPTMHQISLYTHFFFVPNRILWDNWEDFITGGEDGQDASVFPNVSLEITDDVGSLTDYLGLPSNPAINPMLVSAMPFSAYQACYNEYYRDENLVTPVDYELVDGNNAANTELKQLRTRAWQHDYFTSALPWTQKGAEATIPLGTSAPVSYNEGASAFNNLPQYRDQTTGALVTGGQTIDFQSGFMRDAGGGSLILMDPVDSLEADLSTATAATINDLRNAFRLQEWLEKNARGGSRYIESILVHFGVKSSDARLQRPEFLGGSSTPVSISEVLQTSGTDSEPTPQGNMAGHAIALGSNKGIKYRCEEHGYIIGIMSVMPKTAYQQGVPKHFLKFDKFDYYWPSFANLGEQPIQNKEIYLADDAMDELTFGYTPRYAEYKYINSSVHGEFRTTLDAWHMGRKFASRPALNQTFIECDPTTRIFAVETGEKLYCHVHHSIKATRKMPYFGTPRL